MGFPGVVRRWSAETCGCPCDLPAPLDPFKFLTPIKPAEEAHLAKEEGDNIKISTFHHVDSIFNTLEG